MATLQLTGQKPLASGTWRLVFQHPGEKDRLVKVMRADGKVAHARKSWYKIASREGPYLLFLRELHEFVVAKAHSTGPRLPVPHCFGLVDTEFGLGVVVEKLTDRTGALATTLYAKFKEFGVTPHYEKLCFDLVDEINRHRIILVELRLRNIVIVEDEAGKERLMLVDGFGDSSLFPLHAWSEFANTRRNLRKCRKFLRKARVAFPAPSGELQSVI